MKFWHIFRADAHGKMSLAAGWWDLIWKYSHCVVSIGMQQRLCLCSHRRRLALTALTPMSLPKAWNKTASVGLYLGRTSHSYPRPVRYVADIFFSKTPQLLDVEPFSQLKAPWNNFVLSSSCKKKKKRKRRGFLLKVIHCSLLWRLNPRSVLMIIHRARQDWFHGAQVVNIKGCGLHWF